jgi:hypothetical protein
MKLNLNNVSGVLRPKAPPAPTRKLSGREKRTSNELAILRALHAFGHLRTAELAAAVWPDARYGEQLAQRTLRRMLEAGEVLQRINSLASPSWVLASKGVARLELYAGVSARHGRDIVGVAGATFVHRTLGCAYLIHRATSDKVEVFGEYALAHRSDGLSKAALTKRIGKLPDGLVKLSNGQGLEWVEVEASAKPLDELKQVLRVAEKVGQPLAGAADTVLRRVVVVFDARQNHTKRLAKAARELWGHLPSAERNKLLATVLVVEVRVSGVLRIEGFQTLSLLSALKI